MARYTFERTPATEQTDSELRLLRDGQPTRLVIQDATPYGGGYAVSVDHLDDPVDPHLQHLGGAVRTFREAADLAVARDRAEVGV